MIDPKPIPCEHLTKGVPISTVLSDYHPLTHDEVIELLALAHVGDWRVANSIQCRLSQAIPGAQCPEDIEGPVSEKTAKLNRIFATAYRHDQLTNPHVADMLFTLMSSK